MLIPIIKESERILEKEFKCNCILCQEGEHEVTTTFDYLIKKTNHIQLALLEGLKKEVEGMKKPEKIIENCENCGEEGYGKCWYGKGEATNDNWGDRYYPTGSVVFCKDCFKDFDLGKVWGGEEIRKRTSTMIEHDQMRVNNITKTANKEHNSALSQVIQSLEESITYLKTKI